MATTIRSAALDFENIKNNLKTYLEQQEEFKDYNFDASGLSNILDVLAYNTHINGLTANFALNESFLNTAQLRSSVVSLAEALGYVPASKKASEAKIRLSLNLSGITNRLTKITVASGYTFTTTVDEVSYTFQTQENIQASDDGSGLYQFQNSDGDLDISVYQGTPKQKTFIAGLASDNTVYIIPDETIDTSTAVVRVYPSSTSTNSNTFSSLEDASEINSTSRLYILKEAPNGYYELTFGNGATLGVTPDAGNKITVDYLAVAGEDANGAAAFTASTPITVATGVTRLPTITTTSVSAGGDEKESLESMRANAPYRYAAQNRMVTYADYSNLALRKYSSLIQDIISWGGEDNVDPKYGTVFMSIVFKDGVNTARQTLTKSDIISLADDYSVASFNLEITDPVVTYIELDVTYQFNDNLTTLTASTVSNSINDAINAYFEDTLGVFTASFRRSNLLTLIDEVSPAVLSSRADIRMQQRFTPTLTVEENHDFIFPGIIADPDDVDYTVRSTTFTYDNKTCLILNELGSTKLQVINTLDGSRAIDNVGSYDAATGTVSIVGLTVDEIGRGATFIKLSVTPANQSAVTPQREYILTHDASRSSTVATLTEARN